MKIFGRITSMIIILGMMLQTFAVGISKTETKTNNPYELMYDSDLKLVERIRKMPDFSENEMRKEPYDKTENQEKTVDEKTQTTDSNVKSQSQKSASKKEEIAKLITEGKLEQISSLDISEQKIEEIKSMAEDVKEARYIVKYKTENNSSITDKLSKKTKSMAIAKSKKVGKTEVIVLEKKVNPKEFAFMLKNAGVDDLIEYIQPDFKMDYSAVDGSIGLSLMNDDSKNITSPVTNSVINTSSVIVAVIDTGIETTHTGIDSKIWRNKDEIANDGIDNDGNGYIDDVEGWNFYNNSNSVYDSANPLQSAHGTHIAGIIATEAADYNVRIMPLKVFGENGAYTSDIIEAIKYAEANGAQIVNCSFGNTDNNPLLKEAITNSQMLFVCSVGNARSNLETTPIYPACFGLDNIISVTSTNADCGLSYYSNYSPSKVDIAALGRDIDSTLPGNTYGKKSGTSMSAAQVSGAAAALLYEKNTFTASELKTRLIKTADKLSNLQNKVKDGRQLNLTNAINSTEQTLIKHNIPTEDFEVNGYNPNQREQYQRFTGDLVKISGGGSFTIALKENGTVWAWGANYNGQLGDGTTTHRNLPVQVIGLTGVIDVSAGCKHALSLKSDGTVWQWGNLVDTDEEISSCSVPVQVSGLTGIVSVSAGGGISLALKSDGTVWGWDAYGRSPSQVSGLTGVIGISAGANFKLALKADGTVWAWGDNSFGQLGNGSYIYNWSNTPVQVSITGVVGISAGGAHSLARKSDGTVWAWGRNQNGQLGNGTTTNSKTPVQVSGLNGVTNISSGYYFSLASKSNGTVYAWGDGSNGKLGIGSNSQQTAPVQISSLSGVTMISAGYYHGLAVKTDGLVWAWGDNGSTTPIQAPILSNMVVFNQTSYSAEISTNSNVSVTATAQAKDQYGNVISNASLVYGLVNSYPGVSINSSNGVVAITPQAQAGIIQICATYGSLSSTVYLSLTQSPKLNFNPTSYSAIISTNSNVSITTTAQAKDQNGNIINNAAIVYGLINSYAGVSINSSTGVVTITPQAQPGNVQISATYGSLNSTATLSLTVSPRLYFNSTSYSAVISTSSNVNVAATALAKDQYGNVINNAAIVYSLANAYTGVSINSSTGVVTITPQAQPGNVQINATYGSLSSNVTLSLTQSPQLNFNQTSYSAVISTSSNVNVTATAQAKDQYGNIINNASIVYGLVNSYAGVSINSSTGVVTITPQAQPGNVQINAIYGSLSSNVTLSLTQSPQLNFNQTSYSAVISASSNVNVAATAKTKDQYGNVINNASIVYGLVNSYAGVSINSSTGVVTITPQAQPGSVQISANYGSLSSTVTLSLTVNPQLYFNQTSYSAAISNSSNVNVTATAQAKDQYGNVINNAAIVYSLANAYTGVSIDSSTGVVTITPQAQAGNVQISATCGGLNSTTTLALTVGPELSFNQTSYSAVISTSSNVNVTVTAQAKDQYGNVINNAAIVYSLANSYTGVSIDSSTGVVTITPQAQAGIVQISASYGELNCLVDLELTASSGLTSITLAITANEKYYISLTVNNITTFTGRNYTINYDSTALQIEDLCAFTYNAETDVGNIEQAGIEITSLSPGKIVFTVDKSIPYGKTWSGVINIICFKAIGAQTTSISLE